MNSIKFFEYLETLRQGNPGAVARLRRSLAQDPGDDPDVYPFVEPWVTAERTRARAVAYLMAALWAAYGKSKATSPPVSLADAFRRVPSSSAESRFIALLDADSDELPWRLRQAVALITKESRLDWPSLLDDVMHWELPSRSVQHRWAREYYRTAKEQQPTDKESQ